MRSPCRRAEHSTEHSTKKELYNLNVGLKMKIRGLLKTAAASAAAAAAAAAAAEAKAAAAAAEAAAAAAAAAADVRNMKKF
jgi:hypothetical protein